VHSDPALDIQDGVQAEELSGSFANDMQTISAIPYRIGYEAPIKGRQFPLVCLSKRQEVCIRDLTGIQQPRRINGIVHQADVIWPKDMTRNGT